MAEATPKRQRKGFPWVIILIILVVVLLALVVALVVSGATKKPTLVVGNTGDTSPSNPEVGKKDEVRPVILGGIDNWQDVKRYGAKHSWYKEPQAAAGISMAAVRRSAHKPAQYSKAVLVSNSTVSNNQARQQLARKGYPAAVNWPVVRVSGFWNTALSESGAWTPFIDTRSQVRATLLPVNPDGSLNATHGVLLHCGNYWWLLEESENPIPGAHPKPRPSLEPKKWWLFPKEPKTPSGSKTPRPVGTTAPFSTLAPSDPVPPGTTDVNPPTEPAHPDSGSGATQTAPPAPDLPDPPPAPPTTDPTPTPGIVPSD